jgi:hypothetical protein
MALLAPLGLVPTLLPADDAVRLACHGDLSALRSSLEAKLSSKAVTVPALCAGVCMHGCDSLAHDQVHLRVRAGQLHACNLAACACPCKDRRHGAVWQLPSLLGCASGCPCAGVEDIAADEVGLRCLLLPVVHLGGECALLLLRALARCPRGSGDTRRREVGCGAGRSRTARAAVHPPHWPPACVSAEQGPLPPAPAVLPMETAWCGCFCGCRPCSRRCWKHCCSGCVYRGGGV